MLLTLGTPVAPSGPRLSAPPLLAPFSATSLSPRVLSASNPFLLPKYCTTALPSHPQPTLRQTAGPPGARSGHRLAPRAVAQGVEAPPSPHLQTNQCEARAWEVVADLQAAAEGAREDDDGRGGTRAVLGLLLKWGKEQASALEGAEGQSRLRARENRLMGCTSQVWANVSLTLEQGSVSSALHLDMDSDSAVVRGLCAVLRRVVQGASAGDVLALPPDSPAFLALASLLGPALSGPALANSLPSMLLSIQKRTRKQLAQPGISGTDLGLESLPSIVIGQSGLISAQGEFAVSQAQYLSPDPSAVNALVSELASKRIGVVAHFYMDPEVQGVLVAARRRWPHIAISDSLVMADRALRMVQEGGCQVIAVLGVDFMAENVRAVLHKAGISEVPVVRMSVLPIGCSLADAARSAAYVQYLTEASQTPKSCHVIYINTALDTKAVAHHLLPTITCTSSNVLATVLQVFAQIPDATVFFGPDTYMGGNLVDMLSRLSTLPEEHIRALHPQHTPASLRQLLPRVRYFKEGTCIVHDLFGSEVVRVLRESYADAFLTAHFEVPGEMFSLALDAQSRGRGTVGSTQNILDFITARVGEALGRGFDDRLQFVLGTESGMVTAIVTAVTEQLQQGLSVTPAETRPSIEVEIVFPVNASAITDTHKAGATVAGAEGASLAVKSALSDALRVVPGAAAGEGCSLAGGCASCPYMKMNSLDALMRVASLVGLPDSGARLAPYEPDKFVGTELAAVGKRASLGRNGEEEGEATVADLGYLPILHMRHFQKHAVLSDTFVQDIQTRWQEG